MSKHVNSGAGRKRTKVADIRVSAKKLQSSYWRSRLFHNSYTRGGRQHRVHAWSVKMQWAGVRRTISLSARDRASAAQEAAQIYARIVESGWGKEDWKLGNNEGAEGEDVVVHTEVPRLLVRPAWMSNPEGGSASGGQREGHLAVRIEDEDRTDCFHLGVTDPEQGRSRALEILGVIRNQGVEEARKRFSREVTVALHWAAQPVIWTYFTVTTHPMSGEQEGLYQGIGSKANVSGRVRVGVKGRAESRRENLPTVHRVILMEPDPGLRVSLERWIDAQPGFRCLQELPRVEGGAGADILLQNAALAGTGLRGARGKVPRLWYSVYEDSEHLFRSTPGGAHGYVLQRIRPDAIFSPIFQLEPGSVVTLERIDGLVRRHFQAMLLSGGASEGVSAARLTARELEVLGLLSRGLVGKEVAAALGISAWTVHGHVKSIFGKLGVRSRTEAVVHYLGR